MFTLAAVRLAFSVILRVHLRLGRIEVAGSVTGAGCLDVAGFVADVGVAGKEIQELQAVTACVQAALQPRGFLPQILKRPFFKSAHPTATQERVMTMTEAIITYARSSLGKK